MEDLGCFDNISYEFNSPELVPNPYTVKTKNCVNAKHRSQVPIESFETPFLGASFEEVQAWWETNIAIPREQSFWTETCFMILDDKSADTETCILTSTEEPAINTVRVHFDFVAQTAGALDHSDCAFTEDFIDTFRRNGKVMSNDNFMLARKNGWVVERDGDVHQLHNWKSG